MNHIKEKALEIIAKIPKCRISTYKEIAIALGNKNLARAVGNACNSNKFLIAIPCHRVIKSDGKVGGYRLGERKKIFLLELEGHKIKKGKIQDYENKLVKFSKKPENAGGKRTAKNSKKAKSSNKKKQKNAKDSKRLKTKDNKQKKTTKTKNQKKQKNEQDKKQQTKTTLTNHLKTKHKTD